MISPSRRSRHGKNPGRQQWILGRCHAITYDAAYKQLAVQETVFVGDASSDPKAGLTLLYFQYQQDGTKKIVYPESLAEGNTYNKPAGVS